jgi:hypothetical protein
VERILTVGYGGCNADVIVIDAIDDFKVNNVRCAIYNAIGEQIEDGPCVVDFKGTLFYTDTKENLSISGTKIKTSAFDIPENKGTLSKLLFGCQNSH